MNNVFYNESPFQPFTTMDTIRKWRQRHKEDIGFPAAFGTFHEVKEFILYWKYNNVFSSILKSNRYGDSYELVYEVGSLV